MDTKKHAVFKRVLHEILGRMCMGPRDFAVVWVLRHTNEPCLKAIVDYANSQQFPVPVVGEMLMLDEGLYWTATDNWPERFKETIPFFSRSAMESAMPGETGLTIALKGSDGFTYHFEVKTLEWTPVLWPINRSSMGGGL